MIETCARSWLLQRAFLPIPGPTLTHTLVMLDCDSLLCLFLLYWLFSRPGSLLSYLAICSYHGLKCFLLRENLQLLLLFAAQIVPAWLGGIPAGLCRSFLPVTLLRKCFFYFLALKSVLVLDSSSISPEQAVYASHAPTTLPVFTGGRCWRQSVGPGWRHHPTVFIQFSVMPWSRHTESRER